MSSAVVTPPYSVSTGSAFTAFDKLQGAKNYIPWKKNMRIILQSLRQWGMITGTVKAPVPADVNAPTAEETHAIDAFEVRRISAFMEISFRIVDSAKTVLGNTEDPKVAWELLEKRYGVKQQGLQSVLMAKLQLAKWDGSGTIHTHHDAMVDIRTELADAGMMISDQSFYEYFTNSLPSSLDLFITLYDDSTYDINLLCNKFAKYEMRCKLAAAKAGRTDASSDGSLAMFGQASSSKKKDKKEKKKRDHKHLTCLKCGKKGHIQAKCPDGEKKDDKSGEKQDNKSKATKENEEANKTKSSSGTLYTAVSHKALASTGDSNEKFYIASGASDHLIPSRGDLHAYRRFEKPVEISAADGGKIYAYGSGTLRMATSANGLEREVDLEDVYYAPGIHTRLVSLGKLEGQGWDVRLRDGGMELRDRDGDLFADVEKVNNVYPVRLTVIPSRAGMAAWTTEGEEDEATHEELARRLETL